MFWGIILSVLLMKHHKSQSHDYWFMCINSIIKSVVLNFGDLEGQFINFAKQFDVFLYHFHPSLLKSLFYTMKSFKTL